MLHGAIFTCGLFRTPFHLFSRIRANGVRLIFSRVPLIRALYCEKKKGKCTRKNKGGGWEGGRGGGGGGGGSGGLAASNSANLRQTRCGTLAPGRQPSPFFFLEGVSNGVKNTFAAPANAAKLNLQHTNKPQSHRFPSSCRLSIPTTVQSMRGYFVNLRYHEKKGGLRVKPEARPVHHIRGKIF